jgi:hypothetical protein
MVSQLNTHFSGMLWNLEHQINHRVVFFLVEPPPRLAPKQARAFQKWFTKRVEFSSDSQATIISFPCLSVCPCLWRAFSNQTLWNNKNKEARDRVMRCSWKPYDLRISLWPWANGSYYYFLKNRKGGDGEHNNNYITLGRPPPLPFPTLALPKKQGPQRTNSHQHTTKGWMMSGRKGYTFPIRFH